MTEPKNSHEAYQRAKLTGSVGPSNPEHSGAVQLGIQEFHRDQAKRISISTVLQID